MSKKPKFSLNPNPTFKSVVSIPVAGGLAAPVEFTFKHRTRDEYKEFVAGLSDQSDVDLIMDIASGWDLDDPWGEESIEKMVQNYIGSAGAIFNKYIEEITSARLGN